MGDGIRDSRPLLICLSNALPNPVIAAVRPRSIAVVELEDSFVISYLEAPVEAPKVVMAGWIDGLRR